MAALDRLAVEVADRTQSGSLARYIGTILVVLTAGLFFALSRVTTWPDVRLAEYICEENNRNEPDAQGITTAK